MLNTCFSFSHCKGYEVPDERPGRLSFPRSLPGTLGLPCLHQSIPIYLPTHLFFPPFVHSSSLQPVDVAATRDPVNSTSLAGTTYRVSRNFKRNAQRSIEPSPFFQTLHDRNEGKFERKEDRFSKLLFLDGLKSEANRWSGFKYRELQFQK